MGGYSNHVCFLWNLFFMLSAEQMTSIYKFTVKKICTVSLCTPFTTRLLLMIDNGVIFLVKIHTDIQKDFLFSFDQILLR